MPQPLDRIGTALYGPRWQSELARALGVADRTVRRWAASGALPDVFRETVKTLLRERIAELRDVLREF